VSDEEWRDVIGYEEIYQVSSYGRIMRIAHGPGARPGYILKGGLHKEGYRTVQLSIESRKKQHLVHRLVANAFLDCPPQATEVVHKNNNRADNRVENLEWYSRNNMLNVISGRRPRRCGKLQPSSKLTQQDVREIRRLWPTGNYTQRQLAKRFGIHAPTINKIIHRIYWKHVL